jgi:hypothetical protein
MKTDNNRESAFNQLLVRYGERFDEAGLFGLPCEFETDISAAVQDLGCELFGDYQARTQALQQRLVTLSQRRESVSQALRAMGDSPRPNASGHYAPWRSHVSVAAGVALAGLAMETVTRAPLGLRGWTALALGAVLIALNAAAAAALFARSLERWTRYRAGRRLRLEKRKLARLIEALESDVWASEDNQQTAEQWTGRKRQILSGECAFRVARAAAASKAA